MADRRARSPVKALIACVVLAAAAAAQERQPLVGAVLDPAGAPCADAVVRVTRELGQGMELLDLDYRHTVVPVSERPVDRHGRFAVQLPAGIPCRVVIDAPPHALWIRDDVLPGEELRVELAAPATLTGRVHVEGGEGQPARVRVWDGQRCHWLDARTAPDGTFRFERLPSGTARLAVIPDGAQDPPWQRITLVAGEVTEVDVVVEPGATLRGRVTDEQGRPVAGAVVGENWTMRRRTTTGADGTFELRGYGARGNQAIWCAAQGHVRQWVDLDDIVADRHDFRLQRGLAATGTIVDEDGEPVSGAYVAAICSYRDETSSHHDWIGDRTGRDGRFRLGGLRPGRPQILLVRLHGFATVVYGLPDPLPADPDAIAAGRLTLPAARVVTGRLLERREPIRDFELRLVGVNTDRDEVAELDDAAWLGVESYVGTRRVRTDAHGEFAFGDVPPGVFLLYDGPRPVAEIVVPDKGEPDPMVVRLSR